jgi:hypothetical protein
MMKRPLLAEDGAVLEGAITLTDDGWWLASCRAMIDGPQILSENWHYSDYQYRLAAMAKDWIMEEARGRHFFDFRSDAIRVNA